MEENVEEPSCKMLKEFMWQWFKGSGDRRAVRMRRKKYEAEKVEVFNIFVDSKGSNRVVVRGYRSFGSKYTSRGVFLSANFV